jgi:hypothetical protein
MTFILEFAGTSYNCDKTRYLKKDQLILERSLTEDVTMADASHMATVGEIARRLDVPTHKVQYILRTRNIRPSGIAGNCRVFGDADVERIAAELRAIAHHKGADSETMG